MTDPRRWFDDPSVPTEHRRLLLAAAPPPPMLPGQDQAFASLVAKLATGGALGKLLAAPLLTKLFVISAGMSAAMVTGYLLTQPRPPLAPMQITRSVEPRLKTPVELVANSQQPQPATSSSGASVEPASSAMVGKSTHAPLIRERSTSTASRENTIREEAAMLERARRTVSESPQRALALVDEHAKRFPSGQLAAERELIAVQALVSSGRHREASQRARRFSAVFTSSVYQRRMRQILGSNQEDEGAASP
jgi:hypothetical protein